MNKKLIAKGLVITAFVVIAALVVSNNIKGKNSITKLLSKLKDAGAVDNPKLYEKGFEKEYLEAWVASLSNLSQTFEYKSKLYWKKGGKAVVK